MIKTHRTNSVKFTQILFDGFGKEIVERDLDCNDGVAELIYNVQKDTSKIITIKIRAVLTTFLGNTFVTYKEKKINLNEFSLKELLEYLIKTNNENMSNINFTKLATPINRLSNTCYMIISDMLNYSLPYIMFVFVTMVYFVYENRMIGLMFIIGNVLAILLMIYMWKIMWNMMTKKMKRLTIHNNSVTL